MSESAAAEGTTGSSYLDDLPADLDFGGQTVCERLNVKFAYFKLPGNYYDRETFAAGLQPVIRPTTSEPATRWPWRISPPPARSST